jgi:alpha-N-arabinofuranosidase
MIIALCTIFLFTVFSMTRAQVNLRVDVSKPGADIQPTMWGIFFEDINFAADGGIYAEMIKNRSFEFYDPMMGWSQPNSDRHSLNRQSGMATAIKEGDSPNSHFVRIVVRNSDGYELINEGYRGMGVKESHQYNL